MCLSNVDFKPRRKQGVGYKSVRKTAVGEYECYDHIPHAGSVRYPLNQWITDPNDDEADGYSGRKAGYRTGIHLCLDLSKVREINRCSGVGIAIIKLRFRKVVATQLEGADSIYGRQVVAREVCNLGEV